MLFTRRISSVKSPASQVVDQKNQLLTVVQNIVQGAKTYQRQGAKTKNKLYTKNRRKSLTLAASLSSPLKEAIGYNEIDYRERKTTDKLLEKNLQLTPKDQGRKRKRDQYEDSIRKSFYQPGNTNIGRRSVFNKDHVKVPIRNTNIDFYSSVPNLQRKHDIVSLNKMCILKFSKPEL